MSLLSGKCFTYRQSLLFVGNVPDLAERTSGAQGMAVRYRAALSCGMGIIFHTPFRIYLTLT